MEKFINIIKSKVSNGSNKNESHGDQPHLGESGIRKPVVGSKHVAQWGANEFTVLSLMTGKIETKMTIVEKIVSWSSAGDVREEKTWDLKISNESASIEGGKPVEIVLGNFPSYLDANRELQRSSNEVLKDFFPSLSIQAYGEKAEFEGLSSKNSSRTESSFDMGGYSVNGATPAGKKSFLRRSASALGPWVGGAVIVVVLALLIPSSDHDHPHPESNTGASGQSGVPSALNLNEGAPAAWNALSQDKKDLLARINEKAMMDYASKNQTEAELTKPDAIKSLSEVQMTKLRSLYSLKIGSGDKTIFAFEDPLCSACKDFSTQAKNLPSDFGVVVLPIAFQNGARDIAAAALCSVDPKSTWSKVMSGIIGGDKPCDAGYKIIDENNAAFLEFGFRATPALVAQNSSVIIGSMNAPEIAQWTMINAKK